MHTGRPIIRPTSWGSVMVLCPFGHVIHSMPQRDWAGSWLEANATDPKWTVTCDGTLPPSA